MREKCKYYNKHLETIKEYISCLYELEGCGCGGLLHILLDEDNYDDDDIAHCWKNCIQNPEREESKIGVLICEEYMKMSMQERRLLCVGQYDCFEYDCKDCFIENGNEFEG